MSLAFTHEDFLVFNVSAFGVIPAGKILTGNNEVAREPLCLDTHCQ